MRLFAYLRFLVALVERWPFVTAEMRCYLTGTLYEGSDLRSSRCLTPQFP
jgi:hypothetical protein